MKQHKHDKEEWTGRSKEVEVNLYIKPKGTPDSMFVDFNTRAYHALAYAVCEVTCKECGQLIQRRSIIVKPEDLETPLEILELSEAQKGET